MRKRKPMKKKISKRLFKKTVNRTARKNIKPPNLRGGLRI